MAELNIKPYNRSVADLCRSYGEKTLRIDTKVQRKLVWKDAHKIKFIETVLSGFPFPEVFIQVTGELDENDRPIEFIIDGYQRISTLFHYKNDLGVFATTKKIKKFSELSQDEKAVFLGAEVSLRVIKEKDEEIIKQIFSRINSTDYSLSATEKRNASFGESELWLFSRQLFEHDFNSSGHELNYKIKDKDKETFKEFFKTHDIFSDNDYARMYSSQFGLVLVCTMINFLESKGDNKSYGYYFDRETKCEQFLEKYNEDFSQFADDILNSLLSVIQLISSLKFDSESFWISKSGLFTLMMELSKYDLSQIEDKKLAASLKAIDTKFKEKYIQGKHQELTPEDLTFYKAARMSINQSNSRQVRGAYIDKIISESFK